VVVVGVEKLVPEINTILFLVIVVLGALVQTLTGFAMGLIIMAGVALFNIADIAFTAAVVSFISLTNAGIALRYGHRYVDWLFVRGILLGLIPVMALGIILLSYLSEHYYALLKLLLGFVIILAGAILMVAPAPFSVRSSGLMFTLFAGLLVGCWRVYIALVEPHLRTLRTVNLYQLTLSVSVCWRCSVYQPRSGRR
jgi:uncharacterized membrane protein YfcA